MTISAGTKLGRYEIRSKIGAGGMGEVYLAEDTTLGRPVALKLLPHEQTRNEERLRRFKQEAKAASALNHPNIITIHEVGEADGHHFIATEFIEGDTLRKSLQLNGSLKNGEALKVAIQTASALAAAHEAGIVHRDLKPENIMLRRDGYVKVLDFGLAKLTETAPQQVDSSAPTMPLMAHSASGVVLGTAPYMSPEQAAGKKVDARSDIFSFGAVLFEMVAGRRAFECDSLVETIAAIVNQEPKPLPANTSHELAKVILRCLRKDPARRYQTMADLRLALEDLRDEALSGHRVGDVNVPMRRPWAWVIWPALLVVILLAGLIVWQPWRVAKNNEPLRATTLTTLPGSELYPSFSPDGNNVAFMWNGPRQDNPDIYVQTIGSGTPLQLTKDPRQDSNPAWSPDGRWIAFLRGESSGALSYGKRELWLVPPLGGPERKLAEVRLQEYFSNPVYLTWAADSRALIVTDSPGDGMPDALFVVSLETGAKRQLTSPQSPVLGDTNPAVSPDGRALVFRRRVTWSHGELYVMALGANLTAAGAPRRLTELKLAADYPTWTPDSKEILFSAKGYLWRIDSSGSNLPSRLPFIGEDGTMPAFSRPQPGRGARLSYVHNSSDSNIYRLEVSTPGAPALSRPVVAIASTKLDIHCRFSPDGRRVAFASTRSGEWEIWVSDPDGSNAIQLTFMHAQATGGPHWSPDGQRIVFASDLEGQFEVYEIATTGGQPRRITSNPAFDHAAKYSVDGQWIYFCSTRNGRYQLWKVPAAGGDPIQVTTNEAFNSVESRDGAYIYYTESAQAASPLWRVAVSGGQPVKLLDGVVMWDFVLVETGIYYLGRAGAETELQFYDFATRTSKTVAHNLGEPAGGVTSTPDGRTILFSRIDSTVDDLMLVENFR